MPRASLPCLVECFISRRGKTLSSLLIMKIWQARSGAVPQHSSTGFWLPVLGSHHQGQWSQSDGVSRQMGAAGRGRPCLLQWVPQAFHVGEGQWARSHKANFSSYRMLTLGLSKLGFKSWVCYWLCVWPWTSCSTFLTYTWLVIKMGIIVPSITRML